MEVPDQKQKQLLTQPSMQAVNFPNKKGCNTLHPLQSYQHIPFNYYPKGTIASFFPIAAKSFMTVSSLGDTVPDSIYQLKPLKNSSRIT